MSTVKAQEWLGALAFGRRHVDGHGAHELAAAAALAGRGGAAAVWARDRLQGGPATTAIEDNSVWQALCSS